MANKFCTSCGAALEDGTKFCTTCGAAVSNEESQPVAEPQPVKAAVPATQAVPKTPVAPVYSTASQTIPPNRGGYAPTPVNAAPGPDSKYEPITTKGYIGIMLLMCIPVVGFVLILIWAFGGCRKINKRNLARASLIMMVIGLILSLIAGFLIKSAVNNLMEQIGINWEQLAGGGEDDDTRLDDWMNSQNNDNPDDYNQNDNNQNDDNQNMDNNGEVGNTDNQGNNTTSENNNSGSTGEIDLGALEGELSQEELEQLEQYLNSAGTNGGDLSDLGALMDMLNLLSKFQ